MRFRKEKVHDYFLLDTGVENIFINEYMTAAPGDFVKVYLFALMHAQLGIEMSHEDIAKHLCIEHEDVLRAWTYWEKMGAVRKIQTSSEDKFDYDVEFMILKEHLYGEKTAPKAFSPETNTHAMLADKGIRDMFTQIERTVGRVISTAEMMEVISWINDLHAAPEVILYAYSYCVQMKKKDIKYIAAVVKNWAGRGLRDVLAVEEYLNENEVKQSMYRRVFQALGFSRNATEEEKRIMDTWFDTMGYKIDKVLEACKKTSGISNPNVNYVNKVLVNWYEDMKKGKAPADSSKDAVGTADIMKYYELLQRQNEEAAEARRRQVYETVPRIKEIEEEITAQSAEMSKIIISNRVDRKEAIDALKSKVDELNTEKAFLLTDNGFELDYMDIKYSCPECKDTGMLETGEKCQCFGEVTKEKINLITKQKTE